jgi:hypothetical protein
MTIVFGEYTESSSDEKEGDNMGDGNLVVVLVVVGTNRSLLYWLFPSCLATSAAGKKNSNHKRAHKE